MSLIDDIAEKIQAINRLNKPAELDNACLLCDELLEKYGLNREKRHLEGHDLFIVLNFLNVCTSVYLNKNDFQKAWQPVMLFELYATNQSASVDVWGVHYLLKGLLQERQGDLEKAIETLGNGMKLPCSPSVKQRIAYALGAAETSISSNNCKINTLCEALALAEVNGDERQIAMVYRQMSRMFSYLAYGAIGLSVLHKAEQYFKNNRDEIELMSTYMYLALSYSMMTNTPKYIQLFDEETLKLFQREAERYVKMIDVDKFLMESDKAYYYRTYGLVYKDIGSIEKALKYYQEIGANKDVQDCEGYIQWIKMTATNSFPQT